MTGSCWVRVWGHDLVDPASHPFVHGGRFVHQGDVLLDAAGFGAGVVQGFGPGVAGGAGASSGAVGRVGESSTNARYLPLPSFVIAPAPLSRLVACPPVSAMSSPSGFVV